MSFKESITFNHAAFRHGLTEADILWAFETHIFEDPVEGADNKFLLIGCNTKGNPVEVMYNRIDKDRINVFHAMPLHAEYEALLEHQEAIMAEMTEEEADALDELWTKTTPKIKVGAGGGFFSEHRAQMVLLDEQTARILNAKAMAVRQTPSGFVAQMIRREAILPR